MWNGSPPSSCSGILWRLHQPDGLVPPRSHGDHLNRYSCESLHSLQIVSGTLRQLAPDSRLPDGFLPPGKLFVDRFQLIEPHVYGKLLVDYVGRFETLQADVARISSRLNVAVSLEHFHKSKHRDYRGYYNSRTIELVAKISRDDIELFGYDFDGVASKVSA